MVFIYRQGLCPNQLIFKHIIVKKIPPHPLGTIPTTLGALFKLQFTPTSQLLKKNEILANQLIVKTCYCLKYGSHTTSTNAVKIAGSVLFSRQCFNRLSVLTRTVEQHIVCTRVMFLRTQKGLQRPYEISLTIHREERLCVW